MTERLVTNALPKLPGYEFSQLQQPASFARSHGFGFIGDVPVVRMPSQNQERTVSAEEMMFGSQIIMQKHPQWETLQGKVLRFFGYYTEPVTESAVERLRVRKVTVLFYLSDSTVNVVENSTSVNSGIRGGSIMSRHVDANVSASKLFVGNSIRMRAQQLHVVDCDAATRQFYVIMGRPQPEPLEYPSDNFECIVNQKPRGKDKDHIEMNKVMEMMAAAASGHSMSTMSAEDRMKTKMFYNHDREVLNFFGTWENRNFRVNFFLADNTLQVTELHPPNDGRDHNATFVKRGIIPKGQYALKSIDTCSAQRTKETLFFTDMDLACGNTITLFGREFYLYKCDQFTKNHYLNVHGVEQPDFPKPRTDGDAPDTPPKQMPLPPYNGFGTEEDSLGSFKNMVMKPPKKDMGKYIRHANDVLRFSATLANDTGDKREFIVCYYLADDTLSVYEYSVRNNGFVGGKVFARDKVPDIKPENMYIGSTLKLGGFVFSLSGMDERTHKFLETGISMSASGNNQAVELLARCRKCLNQKFSRVTDAYRHFNTSKTGLGFNDLKRLFDECEVKYESDEVLAAVMSLIDLDKDGVISLSEFVENLLGQRLAGKAPLPDPSPLSLNSFQTAQQEKTRRDFSESVFRMFIEKLEARRAFILDTFRIVTDKSIDGLVGVDTFKSVVTDRFGLQLSDDELEALVYRFYYVPNMPEWRERRLSLREFRKVMEQ